MVTQEEGCKIISPSKTGERCAQTEHIADARTFAHICRACRHFREKVVKDWEVYSNGGNLDAPPMVEHQDFHQRWELQPHLSDYLARIGAGGQR